MEQTEQNEPLFGFPVETPSQRSLLTASTWARFLGIIGFVFLGLLLIVFAVAGTKILSAFESLMPGDITAVAGAGLLILVLLIVVVVIGVLSFLLIRGASLVRKGIYGNDQAIFNAGLATFRTFFILYGVVSVLSLVFNVFELF